MEHIAVIDISVLRRRKVTIANKRRWLVVSLAAGLLWLGSGAAYVAAQTVASASVRRITAKVADDRVCRTLATELEPIPDTTVEFFQDSDTPDQVVVTFIAEWPKPNGSEIPPGSQAAGAFIFLFIDDQRVDLISNTGGVLVHEGTASSVSNGTHGFTFVTAPISPGEHVAEIFFLDNVLGPFGQPNGTICVGARSTIVQHQ
jgi:hypothetical protein